MADFNGTILTDKGRNLLAKALTGTELKFTKVSLGDGVWDDSISPESLTDLVSKKMDLAINALDVTGDGTARLRFVLTNTGLTDGFFTREIGIYADDPDEGEILYAVTYSNNPDFIPSDGVVKVENVTDIYTVVSNAQTVEAVISDTVVIATKDDVNTLKTDLESGNITVSNAKNAENANKLNELDSTQFLRKDIDDTMKGVLTIDSGNDNDDIIILKENEIQLWANYSADDDTKRQFLINSYDGGTGAEINLRDKDGNSLSRISLYEDGRVYINGTKAWFDGNSPHNFSANGYQKLANGLIIQWGSFTNDAADNQSVAFPVSFPNAVFSVVAGAYYTSDNGGMGNGDIGNPYTIVSINKDGFTVDRDDNVTGEPVINYVAFGY